MSSRSTIKKNLKKNSSNSNDLSVVNRKVSLAVPLMLMLPAIIFFVLFMVLPLIMVVQDSLTTNGHAVFHNFNKVWTDSDWYSAMGNSFLYAAISLPIAMTISTLISVCIVNISRKTFRNGMQSLFFLPYVTSAIAISIVFANLFSSQGILNTLFGLDIPWLLTDANDGVWGIVTVIIYGVWSSLAFQILILTTALLTIDKRLYDAASIDGASSVKQFFQITLPSIEKTLSYLFTIGLISSIKVFPLALFGNSPTTALNNSPTLMIYIYKFISEGNYGIAAAASLSLVVLIILFNAVVKNGVKLISYSFSKIQDRKETKRFELKEDLERIDKLNNGRYVEHIMSKTKETKINLNKGDDYE